MPLKLSIDYDHASGLFEATLENGARFKFSRDDVGGKLKNNLTLYRRAVVAMLEDKPLPTRNDKFRERQELMKLSAGKSINVVGVKRAKPLNLNDLEIDL